MSLAIFDLDNTLIGGDSDYLWGRFLVEQGIVDRGQYESTNARFYEEYKHGTLDIQAFLRFALAPLAAHSKEKLVEWRARYIEEKIKPILLPGARALIDRHKKAGDTLLVITATNRFVTEPIIGLYGIANILATVPESINGRFTGRCSGVPCFQHGKVRHLEGWLNETGHSLKDSWFYSDSHNDLPLLKRVDNPVAVDPDETLREVAVNNQWPIISLRDRKSD
ncbi:MAG: HAD-IB family hydrolase [Methylococcaceae bacterium]|nr:HAD-IB family hydrolase [Methylococcaceae bacterium]